MSLAVKNPHALNTVGVIGTYFLHPHPFLAVLAGFFAAGFFAFPFAAAIVILLFMVYGCVSPQTTNFVYQTNCLLSIIEW
jgi:hypothetical protein